MGGDVFPLNVPNVLTVLRIVAVPVVVVALLDETPEMLMTLLDLTRKDDRG